MNIEKFIKAIIEEINSFDSDQLVQLNNTYCENVNYPDDQIYSNDANFFADNFDGNVMDAVKAVSYGDYNFNHNWVKYNGNGNLESMNYVGVEDLCESVEVLAENVSENFSDYDNLFDLDEDDFNIEYPFEEGDDYWTIENGEIVQSCWDEQSEELHTDDKIYFSSEDEARECLNEETDEDDDTHLEP